MIRSLEYQHHTEYGVILLRGKEYGGAGRSSYRSREENKKRWEFGRSISAQQKKWILSINLKAKVGTGLTRCGA